jgi:hypothetical protein
MHESNTDFIFANSSGPIRELRADEVFGSHQTHRLFHCYSFSHLTSAPRASQITFFVNKRLNVVAARGG